jgi:uncharacterized membrane protein YqjE
VTVETRSTPFDPAVEPKDPEKSLAELVGDMARDMGDLVRQEIVLAKVEAREEIGRASRGAAMLLGGAIAVLLALIMLSFALAAWLDEVMHPAVALAIVGVLWTIGAAVLATLGREHLRRARPLPQTVSTLKEDVEWAKQQMN